MHSINKCTKEHQESTFEALATKTDLKKLEKDLELKIVETSKELELKIVEAKTETIKRVAGMLLLQAGILIGGFFAMVKFLLT